MTSTHLLWAVLLSCFSTSLLAEIIFINERNLDNPLTEYIKVKGRSDRDFPYRVRLKKADREREVSLITKEEGLKRLFSLDPTAARADAARLKPT